MCWPGCILAAISKAQSFARRTLTMALEFTIINLEEAKYECLYGRGCDGHCCREGRPLVYADEIERIDRNLEQFLPEMRPEARARVQQRGYLTNRRRLGERVMRNADGWCVFFNDGCVLHRVGEAEGDKFRYKPAVCSLFPIQRDEHDRWYVRQKGFKRERWDLACLDPASTDVPAAESLKEEIALARRFAEEPERPAANGITAINAP
jgi:hypothetical protein